MPTATQGPPVDLLAGTSADKRTVLQMLSVLYAPVPITRLLQALDGCRSSHRSAAWSTEVLRPVLADLQKRGMVQEKVGRYSCTPSVVERATRQAVRDEVFAAMAAQVAVAPNGAGAGAARPGRPRRSDHDEGYRSSDEAMRDLRLAVHRCDATAFHEIVDGQWSKWLVKCAEHPFWLLCMSPFEADWMDALPASMADTLLKSLVRQVDREGIDPFLAWLERRLLAAPDDDGHDEERAHVAWHAMMQGRVDVAGRLLEPTHLGATWATRGFIAMMRGDARAAVEHYEKGLEFLRKVARRKSETFYGDFSLFHVPALLACGRWDDAEKFVNGVLATRVHPLRSAYESLKLAVRLGRGQPLGADDLPDYEPTRGVEDLLGAAVHVWRDPKRARALVPHLERSVAAEEKAGRRWLAAEYASLLARIGSKGGWSDRAAALHEACGTRTFLNAISTLAPWQRTLAALEAFGTAPAAPAADNRELRLIWHVGIHEYQGHTSVTLSPREQKRTAGGWTGGRAVALKRLYDDCKRLDHLTDADRRVCACIEAYDRGNRYYHDVEYSIDADKALPHLVGHPLVYREGDAASRLEVMGGSPVLRVEKKGSDLVMRLDPPVVGEGAVHCRLEGGNVLKVVRFSENDRRLAALLGEGCAVPKEAHNRVRAVLSTLAASVIVHSDVEGSNLEEVTANARLHVHLSPAGEGLQGSAWVCPFGEDGPRWAPGTGGATVISEVGGRRLQARRNLAAERAAWAALQAACPHLAEAADEGRWELADAASCLELLLELEAAGDAVAVHWPAGTPFKVVRSLQWRDLRVRISSDREWFLVGGEVDVDETRVLELRSLLEARRCGRFVPLGKGEFVALTQEFERRLDDLGNFSERHAKGIRVHPLGAMVVGETLEGAVQRADKRWHEYARRLGAVTEDAVPTTLQADLRDYQADGFRWLARLARWNVGACLADDMGLGKTVQALAALLLRGEGGPALVVAPTSVCPNWIEEARRFAPTLRMRLFTGPERQAVLQGLGAFDVVVASYALLQQHKDALTEVAWHTAILDEAQAIKNASTLRSKAAMALRAEFRVATTGTPIENHLGELWNLFRFLNPGLLGSREQFEERFAAPIERGDRGARQRLRRLVSPFILRRTKAQVLDELPPRTEITLHVDLSDAERALYEAMRRSALASIDGEKAGPQQRFRILAELMKLRRACCHPRLVLEGGEAPRSSSKLEAFAEVLDELLDNHHKALVFSQFVDHLAVVREHLVARGVAHQYLDGATPMQERQERVAAFQRGEGDVFLISLRAGGTGLNLTAADYVIHMDPWWNPAVEDQASDRAHRIGQQRPVTIYRLVVKNTVEERIVELHAHKRALADGLLEGTDAAARMSAEDLLRLLGASMTGAPT